MARDDYFVIAAQILTYLYACLKDGKTPTIDEISYETLKINELYWNRIMIDLCESGYIEGIMIVKGVNNSKQVKIDITEFTITAQGIEYLHENSIMQKALSFIAQTSSVAANLVSFLGIIHK